MIYGKVEGSGLGLAIAKKIVEGHGGEIYLDGRSAIGAFFKIKIPFAIPQRSIRPRHPLDAHVKRHAA
ncbi:ATP-binding protein [Alloacidobacterium dinghuense]|uniref:histidine kinase n=1 Tax=Alloacidobacterium dinghuense TaxID=2763107 RepID=A0A7G8BDK9_9BACT|nr:ATP-binding protein [Alloacidobacterium dinghuense]